MSSPEEEYRSKVVDLPDARRPVVCFLGGGGMLVGNFTNVEAHIRKGKIGKLGRIGKIGNLGKICRICRIYRMGE